MIQVVADDLDEMGHVNNVVYLRWVETIARAHSEALGFDFHRYQALNAAPVVHRHTITYHFPALPGDTVTVSTRIGRVAGVRAYRETRIETEDRLLAEAETEWVWVTPGTMRPTRIPPEVSLAFGYAPGG